VAVAEQLKAIKLIFVTTRDGLVHRGELIHQMLVGELDELASVTRAFPAGDALESAARGGRVQAGVPRVHVINGTLDEGLLGEVFSNHGLGTLIYANEYEQIRPAKKKDVRAIQSLTKQGVKPTSSSSAADDDREDLGDYFMFEVDKNPVACVRCICTPNSNKGELGLAVTSSSPAREFRASAAS
jgi:amino-acid N-acetyltransferase